MIKKFIYNGLEVETNNVFTINEDNFDNWPDLELNTFKHPHSDGYKLLSESNGQRVLNIRWKIKGYSLSDLNNRIQEFKKAVLQGNNILTVFYETSPWVLKQITGVFAPANWPDLILREQWWITFCEFNLELVSVQWYFFDLWTTYKTYSGISWNYTISTWYIWTLKCPTTFNITVNASGTFIEISIGWQKIRMDWSFSSGDLIKFDGGNQVVSLNGAPIDFSWSFLYWLWEPIILASDITSYNCAFSYRCHYL